jgi:hypothetical protein
VRENGRQPNKGLKLPRLSFARDLIAKLFGHQVKVVRQRTEIVARLQLNAMIQFSLSDCLDAFSDALKTAGLPLRLARQQGSGYEAE